MKRGCGIICLSIFLAVSAMVIPNSYAQPVDEVALYESRLTAWVDALNALANRDTPETRRNAEITFLNLHKMYRLFAKNKYTDDAEFIVLMRLKAPQADWKAFMAKYPKEQMEDFTKQQLSRLKGEYREFSYTSQIPYALMPDYGLYQDALSKKDYKGAEPCLLDFINKAKSSYAGQTDILRKPEVDLLAAYKALNKKKEYNQLKDEVLKSFPDMKDSLP